MIPRKKLDIGWSDLLHAMAYSLSSARAAREDFLPERGLACLSVRSGFDLILQCLALPKGSEVLVSAVTIRDMVTLIEHHGLCAMPVDVDPATCAISAQDLQARITPRTRAILEAHLFGARMPMEDIIRLGREHNLLVFEDCAQAFMADGYWGHPQSDFALFSFGPIKTATALGGAVIRFKEPALMQQVAQLQSEYSQQTRGFFLKRVLKYAVLKALSYPLPYWAFTSAVKWAGGSHDALINGMVRGFAGGDFITKIRKRPSPALLRLLRRRLLNFSPQAIHARRQAGLLLSERLGGAGFPGCRAENHSFWVYPVSSHDPDGLVAHLGKAGIDATRGASNLCVVPSADGEFMPAEQASSMLSGIVYLPFYVELSVQQLEKIADEVLKHQARQTPLPAATQNRADVLAASKFAAQHRSDGSSA